MKALGIEGDTPRDTVATLVAQVKQLRTELQSALGDNKNQKAENERLRAGKRDRPAHPVRAGRRTQTAWSRSAPRWPATGSRPGLLRDLQRRLDGLSGKGGQADLPVGLGLEEVTAKRFNRGTSGTQWVEPTMPKVDAKNGSSGGPNFPRASGRPRKACRPTAWKHRRRTPAAAPVGASKPVYTVPSNSTLMGSIAMTGADRRVPIDGTVNDPYPFKGADRPGQPHGQRHRHPDVAGAVVSGTASGDWTLSCVRGQIRSVTFVFQDGTIRTVPEDGNQGPAAAATRVTTAPASGGLGWISDPTASPASAASGAATPSSTWAARRSSPRPAPARPLIKSDNGSVAVVANNNGSLGTVGISGNEAMGRILAGGVRDMADWVNKALRPGLRGGLRAARRQGGRASGATARHRLRRQGASGQSPHRRPMRRIWIDAAAVLLRGQVLAAAPPARRSCCRTATAPCSTSGTQGRAAARAAARPRGNCSMRARTCAGR